MIRIVHFSDFHLNKSNLDAWNHFIKQALIDDLKKISAERAVDFVVLTGDLIDKGGASFPSISDAYSAFEEHIIRPILTTLNLPIERFLIIPGNHDLKKDADPEWHDLGLREYFKTPDHVQDFIKICKEGDWNGIERVRPFKEFETSLYRGVTDIQLSCFDTSLKFDINGQTVGIACLNSSWRCYDSKLDKGLILVGDTQIASAYQFIQDCEIRIALMHHPYDWVADIEKVVIRGHLHSDFNLLFVGHVHEGHTIAQNGFTGPLFVNVAPGALTEIRGDSRRYSNGFTVVDYMNADRMVICTYKRYNHTNKTFVLNTDLGDAGSITFDIPAKRRLKEIRTAEDYLKTLVDCRYEEMDEHLISKGHDLGPKTIKEAFVLPNITQKFIQENPEGVIEATYLTLQDIMNKDSDILLFGSKESGKTMLLFRLVQEFADRFEFKKLVPIYIDFLEIGSREIETCIKNYLSCGADDISELLANRDVILLLDNLQWTIDNRFVLKRLAAFRVKYQDHKTKRIRIIATGLSDIVGVIPSDFHLPDFDFDIFFIESLHTNQIKTLIVKWIPPNDAEDIDRTLEKIVDNFKSFALPRTAMSVCLFLWSMENKDRKPINQATLLDIFLEILLEKLQGEEIYRERFDLENKMMLLGHIAAKMLLRNLPNYCLPGSELLKVVEDYLAKEVGFDFDAQKLIDYFLQRKIFVKAERNQIKFRFSCFFNFFLAKRMIYNEEFKEYILDEERYYNFVEEIDYYTALVRSNKRLLRDVHKRLVNEFAPYMHILDIANIDAHFDQTKKAAVEKVSKQALKAIRPSDAEQEEQIDKFLDGLPDAEKIRGRTYKKTLELILVLMARVLRNSEGVEDLKLKQLVYNDIVKNTLVFIFLYDIVIRRYYFQHRTLPPNVPKNYDIGLLLKNIPYHVQLGMSMHLASIKIAPIVQAKIEADQRGSVTYIERFLSVFLYSDIQGKDYPKYIKQFIKSLKHKAVMDYTLYKLWNYFVSRARPNSDREELFLDLISRLKIRTEKLPKRMRGEIMNNLRDVFRDRTRK